MSKYALTIFFLTVTFSVNTLAEVTVTYASKGKPQFSFLVPDGWMIKTGTGIGKSKATKDETPMPRVVSAIPEGKDVLWFGFWTPDKVKTMQEADDYMKSLRPFLLANPKRASVRDGNIKGMPARFIMGTGFKDDQSMEFRAALFQLTGETMGMAIYIGRPEAKELHQADIKLITDSLRNVNQ